MAQVAVPHQARRDPPDLTQNGGSVDLVEGVLKVRGHEAAVFVSRVYLRVRLRVSPTAKRRCLPSFFQHCDRGIGDPGDDVEGSHELVTVLKDETFFEASRGCRQSKKHFPVLGKNVEPLLVNAGCLTSNSNRTLKMKNLPIHRLNIALPCGQYRLLFLLLLLFVLLLLL